MSEPITIEDFKQYARITTDAEDALLDLLLVAARETVETSMNRSIAPKNITLVRDGFPRNRHWFELPNPRTRAVVSITYIDDNGDEQTLPPSSYTVALAMEPARVRLVADASWPSTKNEPGAVTVTYTAGYATAAEVPRELMLAVLWLANWYYEQRTHVNIGNITSELPDHLPASYWRNRAHLIYQDEIVSVDMTDLDATEAGEILNLTAITGLTGGGDTKLDGLSTTLHPAGTVVILTFGDAAQWWKLRTKALGEAEDGVSLVEPDDSTTLIWVKIL